MRSKSGIWLVLLIVLILGFSFYRGYLVLSSRQQPATNNTEIKLIVDQEKIKQDARTAETEAERAARNIDLNPSS
jgi:hypothetical protein